MNRKTANNETKLITQKKSINSQYNLHKQGIQRCW